jgi:hypothetical protein
MQYAPGSKAATEIENLCDEVTLLADNQQAQADEPASLTAAHDVYSDKPVWSDGYS